jgi:3-hydroxyacyl-[acyl-carrier-protein] dehydratase
VADPLIIDLSRIDLSAVAVTAEEVGRINPQCGAMRQLDHVIWMSDSYHESVGVKHVRHDEFWVPLHIPGRPMMPGVLMIEAGAQLASIAFRMRHNLTSFLGFTHCDATSFRGQVVPGDSLYLLVRELSDNRRRFQSLVQGVVSGRLAFQSTITGMALDKQ